MRQNFEAWHLVRFDPFFADLLVRRTSLGMIACNGPKTDRRLFGFVFLFINGEYRRMDPSVFSDPFFADLLVPRTSLGVIACNGLKTDRRLPWLWV
jgi:hypothetical protein